MTTKVIFIPGNSGSSTAGIWFPAVRNELENNGITVVSAVFPDPDLARASYWIPFLQNELKVDQRTILVGHSSGAVAAMRLAERQVILGSVLVGAYYTHLGLDKEKQSGYFNEPWNWQKIKKNQQWTILFSSQDDPWISIDEPRYIHSQLNCEYHEYYDEGHFGDDCNKSGFTELSQSILRRINLTRSS